VNGIISRAYGGAAVINALQFKEMIAIKISEMKEIHWSVHRDIWDQ
jgi:hypothetical protein